jgi:hypothetical protein
METPLVCIKYPDYTTKPISNTVIERNDDAINLPSPVEKRTMNIDDTSREDSK